MQPAIYQVVPSLKSLQALVTRTLHHVQRWASRERKDFMSDIKDLDNTIEGKTKSLLGHVRGDYRDYRDYRSRAGRLFQVNSLYKIYSTNCILVLYIKSIGPGMRLSFASHVVLIFTPASNLLLCG